MREQEEPSLVAELLSRRRALLVLTLLAVEIAVFGLGLFAPISPQDRQVIENQTNAQFGSLPSGSPLQLAAYIFAHNFLIAARELIPLLGGFVFVDSVYVTGLAAQVLAGSAGYPSILGAAVFLFPYSLVEFSAYALAVAAWLMLFASLRHGKLRRELKVFALEIAAVVVLLLTAAAMESATTLSLGLGFALWLPTGLALAGLFVFSRRAGG